MKSTLSTKLGQLELKNPILSASGTFGAGLEGRAFSDLQQVGGLVSKTITVRPRPGNPPPRIWETPSGMLNSIGLENRGADVFFDETLPRMRDLGTKVILNIGGESIEEFVQLAARASMADGVDALEVNLSCPNVQAGRLLFSTDALLAERAMAAVKAVTDKPVFAKLSPNVTDIVAIAKGAEAGGADGLTAINTLIGMAVDWRRERPVLGKKIGGLSGPAIRPVALRMVHAIRSATRLPIMGVGGIQNAEDVLQFLAAGADAVQVGTASFVQPDCMTRIVTDMDKLLNETGRTLAQVQNCLHRGPDQAAEGREAAAQ